MQLSIVMSAHTLPLQHLPDMKISVYKTIEFPFTVTYCSYTRYASRLCIVVAI